MGLVSRTRRDRWILLAVASLSLVLLLPRLIDAHFGLFDDSTTLTVGGRILAGGVTEAVEASRGRLRPLYWLFYAAVQALFGRSASGFFLGNVVLMFLTTFLLGWISLALTGRLSAAVVAQLLYLLGGPVVENAYTLSKPELLQAVWMLLSLALVILSERARSRTALWASIGLAALAVVFAGLTKETTPLLVAIAAGWALRAAAFQRLGLEQCRKDLRMRLGFLLATSVGAGMILVLQFAAGSAANLSEGYASGFRFFDAGVIRANAYIWADWMWRDYLYLAILVPVSLVVVVARRSWHELGLQFDALIWMAIWLVIYLPWQFTPEYYLLPFSLGAAFLGAVSVGILARWSRLRRGRWMAWATLATAAVFLVLTLPNSYTNARVQLAMDAANAEILAYVAGNLPEESILLVNIQDSNDFTDNFPVWINELFDRPDIAVDFYRSQDPHEMYGSDRPVYFAFPVVENQFYPSVRLGVHEMSSRRWNKGLQQEFAGRLELDYVTVKRFRSLAIDSSCLFRGMFGTYAFCQRPDMPVDSRRFGFGWELYRLDDGS